MMIDTIAKTAADFDSRPWESMSRIDRERYRMRAVCELMALRPLLEKAIIENGGNYIVCDIMRAFDNE